MGLSLLFLKWFGAGLLILSLPPLRPKRREKSGTGNSILSCQGFSGYYAVHLSLLSYKAAELLAFRKGKWQPSACWKPALAREVGTSTASAVTLRKKNPAK